MSLALQATPTLFAFVRHVRSNHAIPPHHRADHGSLYDLLHNETVAIEGELILPLMRDITRGMRFLHSSDPQILHGKNNLGWRRESFYCTL